MSRKKSQRAECLFLTMMRSMAQVMVASGHFQGKVALWREPGKTNIDYLGTGGRKSTQRTLTMSNGQRLLFATLSASNFGNDAISIRAVTKVHVKEENGLCPVIETVYWSLIGVGPTCGAKGVHRIERIRRVTHRSKVGALTSEAGAQ